MGAPRIVSVLKNRCPACSKAPFFTDKWYRIRSFTNMNPACPHCGISFRQEPGFYYGAAFVSYITQIVLFLLMYLLFEYFLDLPFWYYIGMVALVQILLMPLLFRFSRLMWFMLFGTDKRK